MAPLSKAGEVPVSDARFRSERAMSLGLEPRTSSCQPRHRAAPREGQAGVSEKRKRSQVALTHWPGGKVTKNR